MPLAHNYRSSSSDKIHLGPRGLVSAFSSGRGSSDSSLIPKIRGTNLNSQPSLRSILAQDDLLLSTFLDSPYRQASKPHPFVDLKETKSRSSPASIKSRRSAHSSPHTSPRLSPSKNSARRSNPQPAFISPKVVIGPCDQTPSFVTEAGAAIMPKSIELESPASLNEEERRFRRTQAASERRAQLAPKYLSSKSIVNWENIDLEKMRLSFNPLTKETKLVSIDLPTKKSSRDTPKKPKSNQKAVEILVKPASSESAPIFEQDNSLLKELESIWSEATETLNNSPLSSQTVSPVTSPETSPSSSPTQKLSPTISPTISPQSTRSNEKHSNRWKLSSIFSIFRSKQSNSSKLDSKLSKPLDSAGVLPCPPNLVCPQPPTSSEKLLNSKRFSKRISYKFLLKSRPVSVQ